MIFDLDALFNQKKPAAVRPKPVAPVSKQREEIDPFAVVETFQERQAIAIEDGGCRELEAREIAAAQIRKSYVCYKRT